MLTTVSDIRRELADIVSGPYVPTELRGELPRRCVLIPWHQVGAALQLSDHLYPGRGRRLASSLLSALCVPAARDHVDAARMTQALAAGTRMEPIDALRIFVLAGFTG